MILIIYILIFLLLLSWTAGLAYCDTCKVNDEFCGIMFVVTFLGWIGWLTWTLVIISNGIDK
jgi:hypothetical protein